MMLPTPPEPVEIKARLNAAAPTIRYGIVRHEVVPYIWEHWNDGLGPTGLQWPQFFSIASENDDAWRRWLAATITWNEFVDQLTQRL